MQSILWEEVRCVNAERCSQWCLNSSKFSSRVSESVSLLISTGVLFFHENTDHITGIHKTNQREEYLDSTVDDL